MVKAQPNLSIRRQCKLLDIGRSGFYYDPVGRDPEELALMKGIDEIHLEHPFLGSRKVSHALRTEGKQVNYQRASAGPWLLRSIRCWLHPALPAGAKALP